MVIISTTFISTSISFQKFLSSDQSRLRMGPAGLLFIIHLDNISASSRVLHSCSFFIKRHNMSSSIAGSRSRNSASARALHDDALTNPCKLLMFFCSPRMDASDLLRVCEHRKLMRSMRKFMPSGQDILHTSLTAGYISRPKSGQ